MNWIFLTLIAAAVYTVVNFIDKYLIEEKLRDYRGMPIYTAIIALLFGTSVWFLTGRNTLQLEDSLIVMTVGALTAFGSALYFNALSRSQTSYIIALFQAIPVITLVLAAIFLGEMISNMQLLGFIIILSSVIGMSLRQEKQAFTLDQAFLLVLGAGLFFAIANVLMKFALTANDFVDILVYESWGLFFGGVILYTLFPGIRNAFQESFLEVGKNVLGIMFVNESLFVVAKTLQFLAIAIGSVSLVSVLGGTQVFFGILYGWALTLLFPKIFKEDISKSGLVKKVILSLFLLLGIWLISL